MLFKYMHTCFYLYVLARKWQRQTDSQRFIVGREEKKIVLVKCKAKLSGVNTSKIIQTNRLGRLLEAQTSS